MAVQVDTIRLPTRVEASANYVIRTKTHRTVGYGGGESKFAKQRPQVYATLTIGPRDAKEIMAMFRRQIGPKWAFACKDHSDFEAEDELLDPDVNDDYPLIVDYGDDDRPSIRRIILPIEDTVVVTLDGTPTTAFTIVPWGKIRPNIGQDWSYNVVRWSGEFDFPAQFDVDDATVSMIAQQIATVRVDVAEVLYTEAEMNAEI